MDLVEQGGWKDVEEVRGEENVIKIYCMKKSIFNLKMSKDQVAIFALVYFCVLLFFKKQKFIHNPIWI